MSDAAAARRARLAQLLAAKASQPATAPLHPAQRRLWFVSQLAPHSPVYNVVRAIRLQGELDTAAWQTAVHHTAQRHAPLRTTFTTAADGTPQQTIWPAKIPTCHFATLSGGWEEAQAHLTAAAAHPFDLTSDTPPARFTLLQLTPTDHLFILNLHHIIADGWSVRRFWADWQLAYTAVCQQQPPTFPPLPASYAQLASQPPAPTRTADLAYWRSQLANPATLELPTDYLRPPLLTFRGRTHPLRLPAALVAPLRQLARQEQTTLFAVILAAYKLLLHRLSGQHDLLVGAPVAGRTQAAAHDLIGCFVNTLVLRSQLDGATPFRAWVQQVAHTVQAAQAHQSLYFDELVEALQPPRDLSRQPFFQHALAWQEFPGAELPQLPGLTITPVPVDKGTAVWDLTLFLWPDGDELVGHWEYSTDLYTPATIARLHNHWQTLLTAVAAHPDLPLSAVPLLTPAEEQAILQDWQGGHQPYPALTIPQFISQQASHTPHALALADYHGPHLRQSLTFAQFNGRANQLAHRLQALGVGPDVPVVIHMGRSVQMLTAMLAIMKAGGAYLPIDRIYPPARTRQIIADALQHPPAIVLTDPALLPEFADLDVQTIALDADWACAADYPTTDPPTAVTPDHLAYIIYTSGSTGQPKGVMVPHRGVANLIAYGRSAFAIQPTDRAVQFTSPSFDVSILEIWVHLAAGASVHIPDEATRLSPWLLQSWMQAHAITLLFVTTPLVESLTALDWPPDTTLRLLYTGGDKLHNYPPPDLPFTLINIYGPTEATVFATCCEVPPQFTTDTPAIGRPYQNITIHILDRYGNPTPVGVPGEIHIGGAGLARGYLNRPDLTAERFVTRTLPQPNGRSAPHRLYKTGDLARWLPDGQIAFIGRTDHQVKIRGYRIELGDIEAVLVQHTAVAEAVVLVQEDSPGHKRLAAFLLVKGQHPTLADLRHFVQERLPDYMVPAHFTLLDAWPRSSSDKVDRAALLTRIHTTHPSETAVHNRPRTPAEQTLADIWQTLLQLPQVGIHDNFFELGGDSILSIQIVSRARQAGLLIQPTDLFQHQTIAELAASLPTQATPPSGTLPTVPDGPMPLTPIQHWFFQHDWAAPHHWHLPALVQTPPLDTAGLQTALNHLPTHHPMLRAAYRRTPSGWQQTIAPQTDVPIPLIILTQPDWDAAANALYAQFALDAPPLLRALYHPATNRLLLAAHHLVVDGVSWRILIADLQTVYDQLAAGQPVALPPATASFAAWVQHNEQAAHSAELLAQWPYWRDQPWSAASPIPQDHPGGVNDVASEAVIERTLTAAETAVLLRQLPAQQAVHINDVLLTALAHSLAAWSGAPTHLVDLEGHGREPLPGQPPLDSTRTVGWFTAIYPLLLTAGAAPLADLPAIQQQLQAVPRRGVGFGLLRYLCPDAAIRQEMAALPPAQISFNYLGRLDAGGGDWRWLPDLPGTPYHAADLRTHLLHVNGRVTNGVLQMRWRYSQNVHTAQTISQLADGYMTHLRAMLATVSTVAPLRQPLAPMQAEILRHLAAHPHSVAYHVQRWQRVQGKLQPTAVQAAWVQMVQRHAPLRTTFHTPPGERPYAQVHPAAEIPLRLLDWRGQSAAEQEQMLVDYLRADRQRPFAPDALPLIRPLLIQLGDAEWELLFSYSHLLLDGWSMAAFWRDFWALVWGEALAAVRPYADYVQWAAAQDGAQALAEWQVALAGWRPSGLQLAAGGADFVEVVARITEGETAVLQQAARQMRVTLNTVVQAAWALVWQRWSGADDLLLAVADAGRPVALPQAAEMVGLLVTALPLRVQMAGMGQRPLAEWLAAMQKEQARLRQYHSQPLHRILAAAGIADTAVTAFLRFQNYPAVGEVAYGRVALGSVDWFDYWHFPLNVIVIPDGGLTLKLGHAVGVFAPGVAQTWLADFVHLLHNMAAVRPTTGQAWLDSLPARQP
jgi:amino acid adenylation domain-containing protein/non-ribosomal peptide synthase protein (TIGR01720 family)